MIVSYLQSNVTYGFAIYSQCSVKTILCPDVSVASPLAMIMDQKEIQPLETDAFSVLKPSLPMAPDTWSVSSFIQAQVST
jgi:hypothetical protein